MTATIERRIVSGDVEARQVAGGKVVVEGYAAVFETPSQNLGGFVEQVGTGAFTKTLTEADVRAYRNHNPDQILGRVSAGTLRLATDATGLHYEYDHPADITYARDLLASIERRDINQSSFAFSVVGRNGESWGFTDDDFPLRTLNEVRLFDVSPVTMAVYGDATSVGFSARSLEALCEQRGIDPAALADIDPDEGVRKILAGFTPDDTDTNEERHVPNLAVYRARLHLTERPAWVA